MQPKIVETLKQLNKADFIDRLGLSLLFVESLGHVPRERAGLSVTVEENFNYSDVYD
jgi:hypothetical protein